MCAPIAALWRSREPGPVPKLAGPWVRQCRYASFSFCHSPTEAALALMGNISGASYRSIYQEALACSEQGQMWAQAVRVSFLTSRPPRALSLLVLQMPAANRAEVKSNRANRGYVNLNFHWRWGLLYIQALRTRRNRRVEKRVTCFKQETSNLGVESFMTFF